jgi:hypothetical protein
MKRTRLSRKRSNVHKARMKIVPKYSYNGFSRAMNKKGQIVGYVGTLTWTGKKPVVAPKMKTYLISYWIEPTPEQEKQGYESELVDVTVHAIDVDAMKAALGFYSDYSREWGDYGGFIKAIEDGIANISIVKTTYKDVSL